ncbi:nickel/cobalt transporter [Bradyrhizobium sp. STM 3557]|uniref:nickel/cobalt transporter n=1 Tax=Bradyrhizobium sp. STM 3557 TaxID=578920 RepID=UPI00388D071C
MRGLADHKRVVAWALLALSLALAMGSAHAAPFGAAHPTGGAWPQSGMVGWIFAQQAAFYRSLSGFIQASKDDGSAMWSLLGISFLYGIFHAAGPGHGKAVISSYLVANEETWRRGVTLSFVSAALQSIVAIVIVAIAAVLLGATAKSIGWTVHLVEIVSYGLIILIGLRLLFVKGRGLLIALRAFRWREPQFEALFATSSGLVKLSVDRNGSMSHCALCESDHVHAFHCHSDDDHGLHGSAWGHAHGPEPAELAGAGGWRRGLTAVIAVGLRPCSGAIIVLIFALAQDLFWTGISATLLMGLGTAITVAAIATLAVVARRTASRIASTGSGAGMLLMRVIEVGASALIAVFGGLLLAGYMASEQLWMFTG